MKGLLIGSGQYIPLDLLKDEAENADIIVAIDGGMNYLDKINILPEVLIGDQDSIDREILEKIRAGKIQEIKFPSEKDSTDMEIGIDYLYELACDEIIIFGGTGTRLDHSLANIFLLNKLRDLGIFGKIIDRNNTIVLIDSYYRILKEKNKFVSVIPIETTGAVVSLKGFKYPLDRYFMKFNSTIGISNEILDDFGEVTIDRGRVLLFISKD